MVTTDGVRLVVSGRDDVDPEELADLTAQLRRRLLELDVDDVRAAGYGVPAPSGAKSGELVAAGALAVSLAPAVLRSALRLVETWMQNRPVRTVKVDVGGRTLELGHASPREQQQLVEAFLSAVQSDQGGTRTDGGPASEGSGEASGAGL
ncbi:hypothetical protein ACIHAA_06980 [Streptomyces sp. NPDC052040]|uniref:hypothetical protein n=1 Tax=unclassified Streptomyces TaxID=2593676 RepID=UPI0037D7100F